MVKFNINSRGNKVLYKERSVRMHLGFFQKKSVTSLKQLLKEYLKLNNKNFVVFQNGCTEYCNPSYFCHYQKKYNSLPKVPESCYSSIFQYTVAYYLVLETQLESIHLISVRLIFPLT